MPPPSSRSPSSWEEKTIIRILCPRFWPTCLLNHLIPRSQACSPAWAVMILGILPSYPHTVPYCAYGYAGQVMVCHQFFTQGIISFERLHFYSFSLCIQRFDLVALGSKVDWWNITEICTLYSHIYSCLDSIGTYNHTKAWGLSRPQPCTLLPAPPSTAVIA